MPLRMMFSLFILPSFLSRRPVGLFLCRISGRRSRSRRYVCRRRTRRYALVSHPGEAAGSPEGAAKGASQNFTLSLGDSTATHLLLQVYDYAENYVTYKLNLNPDELAGDVTVKLNTEALTLYKGNVAKLTASVEPFGVQPDTVTWSSDNTDVATVSDNGLVTAVGKGTANITAR